MGVCVPQLFLSLCKADNAKNGISADILELESIYYIYMTTPISFFFISDSNKAKNGTLARQSFGVTGLIHGMHTQLDFESNTCKIPPGHRSSY